MTKLLLLFVCLLSLCAKAQLKFDDTGKVIQLSKDYKGDPANVDLGNLKALSDKKVNDSKKLITEQIGLAQDVLKDTLTGSRQFYSVLFPNLGGFETDLEAFKDYVEKDTVSMPALRLLKFFPDQYNTDLKGLNNAYQVVPDPNFVAYRPYEIKLKFTDPFKKFLLDLYQKTYDDPANAAIKNLRLPGLIALRNSLSPFKDSINRLLRKADKGVSSDILNELITYHSNVVTGSNYLNMLTFLRQPWFKEWFWIKGGNVKLNPLDFTDESSIETSKETDKTKAELFDRYVDSLIERRIRYDSVEHVDDFKKLLAAKGNGKKEFTESDEEKLKNANSAAMKDLLSLTQTINIIRIPVGGDGKPSKHISFSAERQVADPNQKMKAGDPIYVDETKLVVLHNIQKDKKLYLKESEKKLEEEALFADLIDTTIDIKQLLTTAAPLINPLLGSLNAVVPKVNPQFRLRQPGQLAFSTAPAPFFGDSLNILDVSAVYYRTESFREIMQRAVELTKTFVQGIFDSLMALPRYSAVANNRFSTLATNRISDDFISDYQKMYESKVTAALQDIRKDSIVYSRFESILRSSLPPKIPKIKENEDYQFASQFEFTHASNDAVDKTVQVITFKDKDSTTVTSFKYKIDKGRRIQLSAGLVYTIWGLDQTKVEEGNGGIKISNESKRFRVLAGVNVYLKRGLFVEDKSLQWQLSRLSVFAGVGIPDPLGNFYVGPSYDFVPGLRLITGVHLYRYTKYRFLNNTVSDKQNVYKPAGPFVSVAIDPSSFVKALGLF